MTIETFEQINNTTLEIIETKANQLIIEKLGEIIQNGTTLRTMLFLSKAGNLYWSYGTHDIFFAKETYGEDKSLIIDEDNLVWEINQDIYPASPLDGLEWQRDENGEWMGNFDNCKYEVIEQLEEKVIEQLKKKGYERFTLSTQFVEIPEIEFQNDISGIIEGF